MKILITGTNSYVGTNLQSWLFQWPEEYEIDFISVRNNEWKNKDLNHYDVLIHVAGIVHQIEKPGMESLYNKINRDLTIDLARRAKLSGIKQFIFMSTASVYGLSGEIGQEVVIDKNTPCKPTTFYGKSKLAAEIELNELKDQSFKVAILRVPIVYGPNCPGNYGRLQRLVKRAPVLPLINNKRSMIFIDNLSEFIRLLINNQDEGLFFPQNKEYINTLELMQLIAKNHSKNIYLSRSLGFLVRMVGNRLPTLNKAFGNLIYDQNISSYKNSDYSIVNFERSIDLCEK